MKKKPAVTESAPDKSLVRFDPLQRYLAEISAYKLLTREQEKALALRIYENDDSEAAYEMVTSNLRLVVKIALEFQRVWIAEPVGSHSGRQYRADSGRPKI